MGTCMGRIPFLRERLGCSGRTGFSLLLGLGGGLPGLGDPRESWKSPREAETQRGSERSSRGAGTMRGTDGCRERLRRRDGGEGVRGRPRVAETETKLPRGELKRERQSRGRAYGEDAEAAETIRATDTLDRESQRPRSAPGRLAEGLMEGLRKARLGWDVVIEDDRIDDVLKNMTDKAPPGV
ncbi:calcium/calmodulin-dependent protein kinase II inhibitor 1 isoform X1 [Symphalangus syndactylus]|uniref:calcium/calmodulin-dependent protein kinase II inhibitor 1 isoform X1 n=1 Tax=Symphalangus syndactylus TaxID=9590 RepID=UPI0024421626|nr:calcium/calmodulin-dependent protein kinase II inhibitor 1 isoform X1 [Symphalangus syndactylus]